jgi:hypothetical protein
MMQNILQSITAVSACPNPRRGGFGSIGTPCTSTISKLVRGVNASGKMSKTGRSVCFPRRLCHASLGPGWRVRCVSGDEAFDRARESWNAMIEGRFEYKHTLYPQRMIGNFWDPMCVYAEPIPPSRSLVSTRLMSSLDVILLRLKAATS